MGCASRRVSREEAELGARYAPPVHLCSSVYLFSGRRRRPSGTCTYTSQLAYKTVAFIGFQNRFVKRNPQRAIDRPLLHPPPEIISCFFRDYSATAIGKHGTRLCVKSTSFGGGGSKRDASRVSPFWRIPPRDFRVPLRAIDQEGCECTRARNPATGTASGGVAGVAAGFLAVRTRSLAE